MPTYKKLYFNLFNAITDAIKKLEQNKYAEALDVLKQAQAAAEDRYISTSQIHIAKP